MAENSRVLFLEHRLHDLGMYDALRALDLMKREMCSERGFSRHNGTHYYYHLVDVTQDLINAGVRHEPCIVASLLHDYVEDVEEATPLLVEKMFGTEVVGIVMRVTKSNNVDYRLDWNMQMYLELISENIWSALIKTADRKHNFSTLADASIEKQLKQAIETEEHFIPAFKKWRKMYPRWAFYFYSAKTAIEPHLNKIKSSDKMVKELQAEINELKQKLNL